MKLIDLTFEPAMTPKELFATSSETISLRSPGVEYTGIVHQLQMSSMVGTYIDFPGHIVETDDGQDAYNYPINKMYRQRAVVIRLNRKTNSGGVSAAELQQNCPVTLQPGDALIINALGNLQPNDIDERTVFLDTDAVVWIIEQGITLLVSDIYESTALLGVFLRLFRAGVATVCQPVNLHQLDTAEVKLTIMFLPIRGITQIPCRLIAEINL
jgi:kynurenine formamidase